ncbi:MAG: hypothetical protein I3J02_12200 [Prevotella sp.]|nr:hypothetical protein [Prevotella sp.]
MRTTEIVENIVKYFGKTTLVFSLGIIIVSTCLALFLFISNWWLPELNGSYCLGKNIYMIDWDGGGRIIVRGTSVEGNTCYGGERLIPLYEEQYDTIGNVVEYVEDAASNENWIVARTNNKITRQRKYYILDKKTIFDKMSTEEIIKKIECFTDSILFAQKCSKENINLETK